MSAESNKKIVQAAFDRLDSILASHEQLYGADWVGHFPGMPPLDAEGHRQYSETMITAFPDLERRVEDMVVDGDKVAARWTARGTHSGDLFGFPPTGKVLTNSGITIFRIVDGRIVEEWGESDMLGLFQQLGAIPGPSSAPAEIGGRT